MIAHQLLSLCASNGRCWRPHRWISGHAALPIVVWNHVAIGIVWGELLSIPLRQLADRRAARLVQVVVQNWSAFAHFHGHYQRA
eukprot:scaffold30693_cov36-Phaeocystis_antarctica.AAC.1